MRFLLIICAVAICSGQASAKLFRNAYVSFDLPDAWNCELIQTEYVCRTREPGSVSKEAIIILTAKQAGPADAIPAYEAHLKTPRAVPSRTGMPTQSQVLHVETRNLEGQQWVDGMHLGSEVPNYYTRYMATVKDQVGILVTFSAHKQFFSKYSYAFLSAINSLRVTVVPGMLNSKAGGPGGPNGTDRGQLGPKTDDGPIDDGGNLPPEDTNSRSSGLYNFVLLVALLLAIFGVYLLLKKNPKGPPRKKRKD